MEINVTKLRARGHQVWPFDKACKIYGKHRVEKLYEREHKAGRFAKVTRIDPLHQTTSVIYEGLFASVVSKHVADTTGRAAA